MSIKKKKKGIAVSKKFRETLDEKNKIPLRITPAMKKRMYYDPDGLWKIINKAL
tara:strand:+ start:1027 stop:1188 length:162 start_codon:yes stop_codon:yes gene_type:complete